MKQDMLNSQIHKGNLTIQQSNNTAVPSPHGALHQQRQSNNTAVTSTHGALHQQEAI